MEQVLLGFSWGFRRKGSSWEPGYSNQVMAWWAIAHWNEFVHRSFQKEINYIVELNGFWSQCVVEGIAHERKYSRDSHLIVKGHLDGLVERGFNLSKVNFVLLCKEEHYRFCRMLLRRQLAERGIKHSWISRAEVQVPYDPYSVQWYTRGPIRVFVYKVYRAAKALMTGQVKLKELLAE